MKNEQSGNKLVHNDIIRKPRMQPKATIKTGVASKPTLSRKVGYKMDISRSNKITKFSPQLNNAPAKKPVQNSKPKSLDMKPVRHALALKTSQMKNALAPKPQPEVKTSKEIKEDIINEALRKITTQPEKEPKNKLINRKAVNIILVIAILLSIIGYVAFLNLPLISVSYASYKAGISATYPGYCPDEYVFSGKVAHKDGSVSIDFKSKTTDKKYSIAQTESSWDSSAVRNKVNKDSNGVFFITEEGGLTIYTFNNGNASWVNGGILYTITGDAELTSDQVRRIAVSL